MTSGEKKESMMLVRMLPNAREKMISAEKDYHKARHQHYELIFLQAAKEYYRILDTISDIIKKLEATIDVDRRKEK